ncbi:SDR family NAD(P)-dependent oxidoreductase [Amycolatopsis sp. NPDC004625]|uniref:SDR family NAD(P)-dependent oxidoreductase n=1 Tax=Amycolatopsis sp. NPDC004625 TaxID=3154670 RepID=UPI0033BE1ABC
MSVWFITGASRGFGRLLTEAALAAGDQVVAATRAGPGPDDREDAARLDVRLDVTDPAQAEAAVAAAIARFGRIDVLVNNAGYGLFGAVEEASDAEVRALFDTNVFGVLNVTRAALPALRARRSGRILTISSSAGFASGAGRGLYSASKFAVEGLSEALRQELAPHGIHVTIVEPGSFRTGFLGTTSRRRTAVTEPAYAATVGTLHTAITRGDGRQPGDPAQAVAAIRTVAAAAEPPLRVQLGEDCVRLVEGKLAQVAGELHRWRALASSTGFAEPPGDG